MTNISNAPKEQRDVSITPSGFFGDSADMIGTIENFLTEEELETLSSFARTLNVWDKTETHYNEEGTVIYEAEYWKDRVATDMTLRSVDQKIPEMIRTIHNRLKPLVEDFYNVTVEATSPTIVRWFPGQFQSPHADKELHDGGNEGKPNDFPHYDIGCLFYLNDDYDGGELYYPLQELKIKPKPGSVHFHPGDRFFLHGVTEISNGIRYTSPSFWRIISHGQKNE